eukprot:7802389-Pyramimonas_sp.AAC.1
MKSEEGNYMGSSSAAIVYQVAAAVPVRHLQQLHREKYPGELLACCPLRRVGGPLASGLRRRRQPDAPRGWPDAYARSHHVL